MKTNWLRASTWRTVLTAALAALLLAGGGVRSAMAKALPRGGGTVVVVWPIAGPVWGVGVNGKVVWPREQAGRRVPGNGTTVVIWARGKAEQKFSDGNGSTVVVWPRASKQRYERKEGGPPPRASSSMQ